MYKSNLPKTFISLMIILSVLLSVFPYALADDFAIAEVNITSQAEGAFLHAPVQNVSVSENLSAFYGYQDCVTGRVSALDALLKSHELIFGDLFTPETVKDFLSLSDAGYITLIFGIPTSANGFLLNGAYPNDGTESPYGGYNGTTVTTQEIKNGDSLDFFLYQDLKNYSDSVSWFAYEDSYINELSAIPGQDITLSIFGNMYMSGYLYADAASFRAAGNALSGAQLAEIDENGAITDIDTPLSDTDGHITITLPPDEGTYYFTAYMPQDNTGEKTVSPLIMPILKINSTLPDTCITVPSDSELSVSLKDYSGKNYKPFTPVSPKFISENGENTTYYYEAIEGGTYNFRVSGNNYITYADKFKKDGEVSIKVSASDLKPEGKTSSTVIYDKSANSGYNVADIFLNINQRGHLKLESGNTYQLYPLRNWQIIDSLTNNYFVQPDFHYTVIDESGKLCEDIISIDNNGIITAISKGTAIVLVTYDALIYPSSIGDDHFFGAIWPENTGVFVVSVDGADSNIDCNMIINEGRNNENSLKASGDEIDSELDVVYFTGDNALFNFSPETKDLSVSVANPEISDKLTFSGFKDVKTQSDNSYSIPLTEGRNIIKLTKDNESDYQVITAKKVTYSINGGDSVLPGDEINIAFDTIYHPANKLDGIYNMNAQPVFTDVSEQNSGIVGGIYSQYNFATSSSQNVNSVLKEEDIWGQIVYNAEKPLTVPDDFCNDTFSLKGGMIYVSGWGFPSVDHRSVSASFTGVSGFASPLSGFFGSLPDIEIPIAAPEGELHSIALNTEKVKTEYFTGDSFDAENLVVTAIYKDGDTEKRQNVSLYEISPAEIHDDTEKITVTYRGKSAFIPISVTKPEVKSISLTTPPDKTQYKNGDVFDPTGMVINATYQNGKTEEIFDYSFSPSRELKPSDTYITVTYTGESSETVADIKVPITVASASGNISSSTISVYFTLYGDTCHGTPENAKNTHTMKGKNLDKWISKTKITLSKGSTAFDAAIKAMSLAGIPYTVENGNYISSVKGLSELDNGPLSGWMYTVNGKYPTLSINERTLSNGASVILHYTDDYTKEKSSVSSSSSSSSSSQGGAKLPTSSGTSISKPESKPVFSENTFADVKKDAWYYDFVKYVYENSIMQGTENGFEPDNPMTRAQFVTSVFRLKNQKVIKRNNPFSDVEENSWYTDAVLWGYENGYISGMGNNTFAPDKAITREQIISILYRLSGNPEITNAATDILSFDDAENISEWAKNAMIWAINKKIINGVSSKMLAPDSIATRAQLAAILMRFCEVIK